MVVKNPPPTVPRSNRTMARVRAAEVTGNAAAGIQLQYSQDTSYWSSFLPSLIESRVWIDQGSGNQAVPATCGVVALVIRVLTLSGGVAWAISLSLPLHHSFPSGQSQPYYAYGDAKSLHHPLHLARHLRSEIPQGRAVAAGVY